ncbi:hypothetical protein A4H97_06395 [Niastella yeongjuensis]|uniref:ARG and Rhodanese-Phosphatase-superfamily-associated domain-containing protein n=1 Tax=Niastella yeongjuensis TaxID=354355 RepID=A0A1V9ELX6_9BACT|nr:DUF6569 family protein [Niastella yeongjuensis]OQP47137.1 hypothetical protein A4H97_06395 [Niastella yeongjuensis]SEN71306.1 hypothetical protein SAMN05660816_01305 [Niastella yeongjuensis]
MVKKLLLLFFLFIYKIVPAQLTYQTLFVDYDSAWTYKNLKIIPIRPKGPGGAGPEAPDLVSLSRAIASGTAVVTERGTAATENVHWLRINNNGPKPVYISSGEIILGGRQDRMVAKDTVLPPSPKDQYVPVMCVEEGRWSEKEKKFAYNNYADPALRKVLGQTNNQVLVWKEVFSQMERSGTKSASLAYLARRNDKKYTPEQDAYMRFFQEHFNRGDSSITGFVCMSGDKVIGCDIYAGNNLFYGEMQPLLHGYIEEAISFGSTPVIKDDKVKEYLHPILTSEPAQEVFLKKNGKVYKYKEKVVHITGYAQ